MHRATIEVIEPDEVSVRLTCIARVKVWRKLESGLEKVLDGDGYFDPQANELLNAIRHAIDAVEDRFYGEAGNED